MSTSYKKLQASAQSHLNLIIEALGKPVVTTDLFRTMIPYNTKFPSTTVFNKCRIIPVPNKNGVNKSKTIIPETPDDLFYGIEATKDIEEGELITFIPNDYISDDGGKTIISLALSEEHDEKRFVPTSDPHFLAIQKFMRQSSLVCGGYSTCANYAPKSNKPAYYAHFAQQQDILDKLHALFNKYNWCSTLDEMEDFIADYKVLTEGNNVAKATHNDFPAHMIYATRAIKKGERLVGDLLGFESWMSLISKHKKLDHDAEVVIKAMLENFQVYVKAEQEKSAAAEKAESSTLAEVAKSVKDLALEN